MKDGHGSKHGKISVLTSILTLIPTIKMTSTIKIVGKVLTRKKIFDQEAAIESSLGRVLTLVDLTGLGVGSTLGVGVYVLVGEIARHESGPAVVISYLVAATASLFAGVCYGELAVRVPRAGSVYIYSYVCIGELVAFVIGWNMILEYMLGSASVARGLSLYLDSMMNNSMKNSFAYAAPINVMFLSSYFDFFACFVSLALAIALAFGLKESTLVNNAVTLINVLVVFFFVIVGSFKTSVKNWNIPANMSNPAIGNGGFFPFGFEGTMQGAATSFYGFVGFDCIATTGEEVKNPRKSIPIAILVSLLVVFLAYFGTSTVATLMVPYYDQGTFPEAFEKVGWKWAKWIVSSGGLFGLSASLYGAMFPLPRIIYAMASDRILFHFLGKVSAKFKTPVIGTLLAGTMIAITAGIFDLGQLVDMMSLATLMAYSIVAASVLLLRYVDHDIDRSGEIATCTSLWKHFFNCRSQDSPSLISERIVKVEVMLFFVLCILCDICVIYLVKLIAMGVIWAIVVTSFTVACRLLVILAIATQPESKKEVSFRVPFVPFVPAFSIFMNVYLMLNLSSHTWIRFAVWMTLGSSIYGFYSVPYSVRTYRDREERNINE